MRDEVDQLLHPADQRCVEIRPVAHPAADAPPCRGEVGWAGVRPAQRLTYPVFPVGSTRHNRPLPGRGFRSPPPNPTTCGWRRWVTVVAARSGSPVCRRRGSPGRSGTASRGRAGPRAPSGRTRHAPRRRHSRSARPRRPCRVLLAVQPTELSARCAGRGPARRSRIDHPPERYWEHERPKPGYATRPALNRAALRPSGSCDGISDYDHQSCAGAPHQLHL
jgi:hypothetical protein